jgi:DNA-binding transcriptional regulator YiaG
LRESPTKIIAALSKKVRQLMPGHMTDPEYKRFVCRNLKLARQATELRLVEFARRIGVSPQALANYEAADAYPPRQALVRACNEFGFTTDFFYRGIRRGVVYELAIKLPDADCDCSLG